MSDTTTMLSATVFAVAASAAVQDAKPLATSSVAAPAITPAARDAPAVTSNATTLIWAEPATECHG